MMFQPEVKLEFVRRYCPPADGWEIFVDIDASEEGRTGKERESLEAIRRQSQMKKDAKRVRRELALLGVTVGGSRAKWFRERGIPAIEGDRDVVAVNSAKCACVIVEVEGASSGQPEQKLYKAIGQIVMAANNRPLDGWNQALVLVVYGDKIAAHLKHANALVKIGISALALANDRKADRWLFQDVGLPKLLGPSGGSTV